MNYEVTNGMDGTVGTSSSRGAVGPADLGSKSRDRSLKMEASSYSNSLLYNGEYLINTMKDDAPLSYKIVGR